MLKFEERSKFYPAIYENILSSFKTTAVSLLANLENLNLGKKIYSRLEWNPYMLAVLSEISSGKPRYH